MTEDKKIRIAVHNGNFHADERLKAWMAEFFDKRPDVKIVGDDYANWNKDEAMALMEDWVTKVDKPIGLIASMNDTMCAGALAWAQLGRLVYGAPDPKHGFMRLGCEMLHPKTEVADGILADECLALLKDFFRRRRT